MNQEYHNKCEDCGKLFWTEDAFKINCGCKNLPMWGDWGKTKDELRYSIKELHKLKKKLNPMLPPLSMVNEAIKQARNRLINA